MNQYFATLDLAKELTDEVIEPKECTSKLTVGLHDDPYPRANTSVNELYI